MGLSARAARVLTKYDIRTVDELRECWTAAAGQLVASHLPNVGQRTVDEIARVAAAAGPLSEAEQRARQAAFPLSRLENQAYAAAQWLSGEGQRQIARQFGFREPSAVNRALIAFMQTVLEKKPWAPIPQGHRKALVREALVRFLDARDDRDLRQVL